jgi:hypothetical protein
MVQEIRDFVKAHMQRTVNNDIDGVVADYTDRVDHYSDGMVGHDFIRADRQKYVKAWPDLTIQFTSEVQVTDTTESNIKVATFSYSFRAVNSAKGKHSDGTATDTFWIENTTSGLKINAAREVINSRN